MISNLEIFVQQVDVKMVIVYWVLKRIVSLQTVSVAAMKVLEIVNIPLNPVMYRMIYALLDSATHRVAVKRV